MPTHDAWPHRLTKVKADGTEITVAAVGRARAIKTARKLAPLYKFIHVDKLNERKGQPIERLITLDTKGETVK